MNFVVYKTNTLKAAKNRIEELLKAVSRSDIDSPHIVIVPDRASLAAERSMLAAVGGSFNIQVFTFNRYAGLIAPETLKPLSGQMAVLEMMKVIEQNADRLVCFSGAGNTEGFARKIYDVISLLKYNRISPEKLLCACDDKALSLKLKDIALVYSAFQASVENRYLDSADKLETLLNAVGSSEQVKKSVYYIYDFDGLSVQEEAIVESLVRYSRGVYAACAAGAGYMYSNGFYASLNRIAAKTGGCREINVREDGSEVLSAREKAVLREKERQEEQLDTAIAELQKLTKGNKAGASFSTRTSNLNLPVEGGRVKRYRDNMAEITGPKGARITAIYEGKVVDVKRNRITNRFDVYIAHGQYITSYANLNSVSVAKGQTVAKNSAIGVIGPAVDIQTMKTEYRLVFGIYPPAGAKKMRASDCFRK